MLFFLSQHVRGTPKADTNDFTYPYPHLKRAFLNCTCSSSKGLTKKIILRVLEHQPLLLTELSPPEIHILKP